RLFHEEKPELMGDKPLSFACSCSPRAVASMLQSLGEDEARLFHEEKPELMGDKPLSFACSCSPRAVASMLQS
ncbi:hypothetical protein C7E25_24900, partial [Stenotrophomonas maltophilia]